MNEENLLDLSQMSWLPSEFCENWQTLNACILDGDQIEAATVLNILNGILSSVSRSDYEVEKLHLEPDDAAKLGRTLDCLTRLYRSYHRQYIREQDDDQSLSSDQTQLEKLAKKADLYGEFISYLKSAPQSWQLNQMKTKIQQLETALEGSQEENKRLLGLNNQSILAEDLEEQLQNAAAEITRLTETLEARDKQLTGLLTDLETAAAEKAALEATVEKLRAQLAAQPGQPQDFGAGDRINLEAYIETLKAELAAKQEEAQAAAQLAAERIAKLETELAEARKAPAVSAPVPGSDPAPIPEEGCVYAAADQTDPDTFSPTVVTDGVCTVEFCDNKTKIGAPAADLRDRIEYLDLTRCEATEIAAGAFRGCTNLKQVVLPLSMVIGVESFADCPKLEEVYLEYAPGIGERAFHGCLSLKRVHFTSRRTEIGKDAFALCPEVAFRCRKNSSAAAYAAEHGISTF